MKAILQNFKNGEMSIEDVPPPILKNNGVLVDNVCSFVSAGTEKAIIELAKMNPIQKARARPDLVKKFWKSWPRRLIALWTKRY